jgi:hypothetical protein
MYCLLAPESQAELLPSVFHLPAAVRPGIMTALRFHLYHILNYIHPQTEGPQGLVHFNKVTTYIYIYTIEELQYLKDKVAAPV